MKVVANQDGKVVLTNDKALQVAISEGNPNSVLYVPQDLTQEQEAQARENIGAGTYSKPINGIPISDIENGVIPESVEANPLMPTGVLPSKLECLKIGSSYYSINSEATPTLLVGDLTDDEKAQNIAVIEGLFGNHNNSFTVAQMLYFMYDGAIVAEYLLHQIDKIDSNTYHLTVSVTYGDDGGGISLYKLIIQGGVFGGSEYLSETVQARIIGVYELTYGAEGAEYTVTGTTLSSIIPYADAPTINTCNYYMAGFGLSYGYNKQSAYYECFFDSGERIRRLRVYSDGHVTTLWTKKANYYKPSTGIPASDLAAGVIPDVSNFITNSVNNLVNYYLKSETYTKDEVTALVGAIQQFHYEIYASTSAVTAPETNVLYLIGPTGSGTDRYEEYVYSNDWVKIGDTSIDLSQYVTITALNTALTNYTTTTDLMTLLATKQDNLIIEVGGMERFNVSGGGTLTITGTRGQFPRITTTGTYKVITKMQSATSSYGLTVTFGSTSYTVNTTNGVINDERELTLAENASWSGSVVGTVAGNTYIYVSVVNRGVITTLSSVAVTGSYTDLSNKPSIPAAQVPSDWNATTGVTRILNKPILSTVATSGSYNDLANKPSIPSNTSDLTNDSGFITSSDIPEGAAASNTIPLMDGTADKGSELTFARGDHRHPSDTNKQDVIVDLPLIREGAALGMTALQSYTETDPTVPAWAKAQNKPTYTAQEVGALPASTVVPTKTSDLTNDSGFITTSDIPEGSAASTTTPKMDGTAEIGTEMAFARGDHRHPSDTSKQDKIDSSHKLDYSLLDNAPTIPTVPTISNDITTDAASTTKTASPKAVKDYVDTQAEIYWATYGTTTFNDIVAADAAGKICMLERNGRIYILRNIETAQAYFVGFYYDYNQLKLIYLSVRNTNQWVASQSDIVELRSQMKTNLSSVDNSSYPSTQAVKTYVDTNIPDVSNFITKSVNDLANYYTKDNIDNLIGAIQQFHYEIAATTSAVANPQSNILYLIGPTGSGADKYEEYVYSNNDWVKIGDTSIDLSGYITSQALNTALSAYTTTTDLNALLNNYVLKSNAVTNVSYNTSSKKLQKTINGTTSDVVTFGSNAFTSTAIPTKVSDITNDSGFIAGITSSDVTSALGFTPYNATNPNGYTSNIGTVTSVNNVSPVNGNVSISIPSAITESTVAGWGFTKNTGTLTEETDPTVPAWAKSTTKPSYTAAEVGALPDTTVIPAAPGTLQTNLSTTQSTSSSEALSGNIKLHKIAKTGKYSDLINTPVISTNIASDKANNDKITGAKAVYDEIHPNIVTTYPSGGMSPNILYKLGTISGSITFSLAAASDTNIINLWHWTFETGSTVPTITWPAGLIWQDNTAPIINSNKHYEINVLDNYAVFLEV